MPFDIGTRYTRDEIHDAVGGGSRVSYLPNRDGVILCACLTLEANPDAPYVILPGKGREIERSSDILCRRNRDRAIPVFIKRNSNQWEFVGNFIVDRDSTSQNEISMHARRANRTDVTRVVHMKRV